MCGCGCVLLFIYILAGVSCILLCDRKVYCQFQLYVCVYTFTHTHTHAHTCHAMPCHAACGISVLQARIEPGPWNWKQWILTTWPPDNSCITLLLFSFSHFFPLDSCVNHSFNKHFIYLFYIIVILLSIRIFFAENSRIKYVVIKVKLKAFFSLAPYYFAIKILWSSIGFHATL